MWCRIHSVIAGVEHVVGGVNAHAAGVGAGVALADALVVLRRSQRSNVLAVAEAEEADLVAFEKLLEDDLRCSASPSSLPFSKVLRGLDGGVARLGR